MGWSHLPLFHQGLTPFFMFECLQLLGLTPPSSPASWRASLGTASWVLRGDLHRAEGKKRAHGGISCEFLPNLIYSSGCCIPSMCCQLPPGIPSYTQSTHHAIPLALQPRAFNGFPDLQSPGVSWLIALSLPDVCKGFFCNSCLLEPSNSNFYQGPY